MNASALEKITWPLVYGGILVLLLGISTLSLEAAVGWPIVIGGAFLTLAGVLAIYLRSRIKD